MLLQGDSYLVHMVLVNYRGGGSLQADLWRNRCEAHVHLDWNAWS